MLSRLIGSVTSLCLGLLASACSPEGGEGPEREIIRITGNLYEARDPVHNTVFLVTPEGVILGDPMGVESAQWIKDEITERFDLAVEYVIYSHHHPEHATGGSVSVSIDIVEHFMFRNAKIFRRCIHDACIGLMQN